MNTIPFCNKIITSALFILGFLILGFPLYAQNANEQEILDSFIHKEVIVYKMVDDVALEMTIFFPDSSKIQPKNPWMLHVHGGGWAGGNQYKILKKPFLGSLRALLDNGVVCATIEYRKARGNYTAYDAVVDAKDAAKYLLKHASQYKLDIQNYGIWGGSAGGHLSLVTALGANSDFMGDPKLSEFYPDFKCVAAYFPFTSCLNPSIRPGSIFEDETLFVRLLGAPLNEKPELARLLSPTELLTQNSPPILLLHGDQDTTLPISNSIYMMEVAKEKHADVELLTVKNAEHSFNGEHISPSIEELNAYSTRFMLSHLVGNDAKN